MQYFLGIDIGTYESKGVLTDKEGNIIASATHPHKMLLQQHFMRVSCTRNYISLFVSQNSF